MGEEGSKAARGGSATSAEKYKWERGPAVAGDVVTVPRVKAELLKASLASELTDEVFKVPAPRVRVQGAGEVPVL